jgi:hypothetical protein
VRNQVYATTHIAAHWRLAERSSVEKRRHAKIECPEIIHLSDEQPILGLAEADRIRELRFRDEALASVIDKEPFLLFRYIHDEIRPIVRLDSIAFLELHAPERCAL